jgi:hypothetical protein
MDLSQSARNYLDDLTHQPAARAPATLGEIWDSEWKRGGLDTISGLGKPLADAQAELVTAIETAAGKPLADYAADKRIQFSNRYGVDQHIATLNALADTLPEESRKAVDPFRDVRRRSMQAAQQIEKDAADTSSATYGLAGTATAWAAGIARQSVDPVNLALMAGTAPLGGPITGGAVKFIAGQAAGGAIAQAAVEPVIEPARERLGLESGVGRAATNILEAGIGGAVLGGGFVGLHRTFGAAARAYRGEVLEQPSVTAARHPTLVPDDFEAAALHAERDAVIEAQRPPTIDPVAHAEGIAQARTVLEEGKPGFREIGAEGPPSPPVDLSATRGYLDSRGQGGRFHGATDAVTGFDEGHYGSSVNYYGAQGFYSTEALDVAHGYANRKGAKRPTIYEVQETKPTKIFDMEAEIAPDVRAKIDEMANERYGETAGIVDIALEEKPKNLREFFDAVRGYAASERIPADEIQEGVFHPLMDYLAEQGFHGMSHRGGLLTKTPEHKVTIYFNPSDTVRLREMSAAELKGLRPGQRSPPAAPAQPELPLPKPIEPKGPPGGIEGTGRHHRRPGAGADVDPARRVAGR